MTRTAFPHGRLAGLLALAALFAALLVPGALAHDGVVHTATADPAHPLDQPELGLVYAGLEYTAVGPCAGGYRVKTTTMCTHGPDPGLPVSAVRRADAQIGIPVGSNTKVQCVGNGTGGHRVHVLYVRASDVADNYAAFKAQIGSWAVGADRIYRESAAATAGVRHIRFVHDSGCNLTIDNVVVAPPDDDTFGATKNAVAAQGYNLADRKYLMFVDATVYCGIANRANDDSPGAGNASNGGPGYARIDFQKVNCNPEDWIAAHELGHNLGAVQNSAPNWSGAAHCIDDYDRLCQNDGVPGFVLSIVCPSIAFERLLDCNHDDYFHTSPAAGSYLDTHWNVADSTYLSSSEGDAWGFVRADDPTAASYTPGDDFNENSTGALNTVERNATGVYSVVFTNLGIYGSPFGIVHVTAHGSAGEYCNVSGWGASLTPDLIATVRCFSAAGVPVDAQFDASFLRPLSTPGDYAALWADQESAAAYTPSTTHQFNSTGVTNTIVRNSTGDYAVQLPGLASTGGTVKVTTFSASSNYCKAEGWAGVGADEVVDVLCFDFTGAPVDAKFTLAYAEDGSILANGAANGYVWANNANAASYTPNSAFQFNSTGATNTITRTGTGRYTVNLPGLGSAGIGFGSVNRGTAHVTGQHTTSKRCEVVSWWSGLAPTGSPIPLNVDVACHAAAGTPADARFVLQFTK